MNDHFSHLPPILNPDQSNRADVLSTVAAMILGRSAQVLDVEVHIRERVNSGAEEVVVVAGPIT